MTLKLDGNTILITGGSSGIGFELASRFIKLGNTVIITGREQARLEEAKKKLPQIYTLQSDVNDAKSIQQLYEQVVHQFPKLNFLINNAGIMRILNLHDETLGMEETSKEIETNLIGPVRMVKQFLPHLKKQEAAAIMNVSSGLAFVPLPISPVYCATKAGLHSFTQSLRLQLKDTRVKVFELAPPATQTPLLDQTIGGNSQNGISVMDVGKMVDVAIRGLEQDRYEITPGQSSALKKMSRFAPRFILQQMGKSVDQMLAQTNK